tara:strand:- start:38 stop:658 length:621 start_codon:yes stop_codon:yes gene_type:complete
MNISELNTGDILLFSERGNCFASMVERCTRSKYSHVAMVLKNPTYIDSKLKGHYLLESTFEVPPDAVDHKKKFGVQIQELNSRIRDFNGNIYWRKLNCERTEQFYNKLARVYDEVKGILYDTNPIDWFKAAFKINLGNVHKTNTFWCSALLAYMYVQFGFLPETIPWTIISPVEFSDRGDMNDRFIKCNLEPEKLFTYIPNSYTIL